MILRKPYAFLIKKFRLIHFLLSIALVYIIYKTNQLYSFFSSYLKDTEFIKNEIINIDILVFCAIIFVLFITIIITVLMNKKEKPIKYYFLSICTYLSLVLVLLFANSQLYQIAIEQVNLRTISILKDLLFINYIIQYPLTIISISRTIGFNIKKFGFQNDLKDLQINEEDSEEFELDVEVDVDDVKTKFRRSIRITKYILRENKILFISIGVIGIIVVTLSILLNIFVYNKTFKENQVFKINNWSIKVLNSYETVNNYKLTSDLDNGYVYNVVDVEIKNNSNENRNFDKNNIKLKISKNNSYSNDEKLYKNFIDLGVGLTNQIIESGKTERYIFVFKVKKISDKYNPTFQILVSTTKKGNVTHYNYAKVKLNLKKLDTIEKTSKAKLGEVLNFQDSLIHNSTLKIDSIDIMDYAKYEYTKNINNKDYKFVGIIQPSTTDGNGRVILKIKEKSTFDKEILNPSVKIKFIEKFGSIRYVKNKIEYEETASIIDSTPEGITDYKYLEVAEEIKNSDNIYLDITIRNKLYTYILK